MSQVTVSDVRDITTLSLKNLRWWIGSHESHFESGRSDRYNDVRRKDLDKLRKELERRARTEHGRTYYRNPHHSGMTSWTNDDSGKDVTVVQTFEGNKSFSTLIRYRIEINGKTFLRFTGLDADDQAFSLASFFINFMAWDRPKPEPPRLYADLLRGDGEVGGIANIIHEKGE